MTVYGMRELSWDKTKVHLIFRGKPIASLVPCKEYEKHYHIKFSWREKETPEFFDLTNARENARIYSLATLNNNIKKPG